MKTKKQKQETAEQEIAKAFLILNKHNIACVSLHESDFAEPCFKEYWKRYKIKPTPENLKKAKEKAIEYFQHEQMDVMVDAILSISTK